MHRLYGRRSERHVASPEQLSLDFGESDPVEVIPDVTDDETFVVEHEAKKKRRKKKRRGGQFPDHLERRVERIEPVLPEGVRPEDCELIGVDVVEVLDFERPRLWVRRLEYPKYKLPSRPELTTNRPKATASKSPTVRLRAYLSLWIPLRVSSPSLRCD